MHIDTQSISLFTNHAHTCVSLAILVGTVLSLSLSLLPPLSQQLRVPDQVELSSSIENLICMKSCQHAQLQA